ncbi:ATP-binding protein [Psychromonas antarctica]|uniref:tetratricopeptide repeat protein n=1 Tax=Psychromonas antarctica TaxID=67573 RepID=UPI001EE8E4BC|nr:ATP-binding protein [Psychromonas antarctica]MCG6202688.1 ATP-binding protein [Psychromonas antarctica]
MKQLKLANNYKNDIVNSQNTPLLIELSKKNLSHFDFQLSNNTKAKFPFLLAQKIYDDALSDNTTNIIAIDGDSYQQGTRFYLLESLLDQLGDEIKDIKNIATLKETLKAAVSVATGGLLGEFIGSYLDKGVEYIFEGVTEHFSQFLVDKISDKINTSNIAISSVEGFIQDAVGDSLGVFIANASDHQLQLSSIAKTELNTLSKEFSKSSKPDVFQLTFKLLLAICIDSPKLVYINNPHKLDENSLAIISLLLSYSKHQKDIDKNVGISIVYSYNDETFQPYFDVSGDLKEKQKILSDQRRFAQRYAMLEIPSSDIPKVAVKSSLFVARNDELKQLQFNFEQRKGLTISVVSGEPGVGKTSLVNQHLKQIETSKMITLTQLNEVGHSSSNTGLSSLEKSILDEKRRLTSLQGWRDKGVSVFKGLASQDNALKIAGAFIAGTDKALAIAISGHARLKVDRDIEIMKQSGSGDLDKKQNKQKDEQFNKLDKAIDSLLKISDSNLPLVLFIDDCQWIDNDSCEYIFTRLAEKVSLYIVTTVRSSDAATSLQQLVNNPKKNHYCIALLKAIGTHGHQKINRTAVALSALNHSTINLTNLTGFDRATLHELITLVIKGKKNHLEELANTIFHEVSGQDATNINTLFAIESINMLCDRKLYSENKTTPLIMDNPLRINADITDVSTAIKDTFAILQNKYKDSFSHYEKSSGQGSFNLMSYAVLEERLHILQLYFAEYGNAAVNTLLFSSLLSAPFSSVIVKKVLQAIANTEEPLLAHLKAYVKQGQQEVELTTEHYSIIDEVYEILSRYTLDDDKYKYRHALLHVFFDKQFEHLLDSIFIEDKTQSLNSMLKLILRVIEYEEKSQVLELGIDTCDDLVHIVNIHKILPFKLTAENVIKKGVVVDPESWMKAYICNLEHQRDIQDTMSGTYDTDPVPYQIHLFIKPLYKKNKNLWAKHYARNLSRLGSTCDYSTCDYSTDDGYNYSEKHYEYLQRSCAILKPLYQANKVEWAVEYTHSLNSMAEVYLLDNSLTTEQSKLFNKSSDTSGMTLRQKAKQIIDKTNTFHIAIHNSKKTRFPKAIQLIEESITILKDMNEESPSEELRKECSDCIQQLARANAMHNRLTEVIKLYEESLVILKALYEGNPVKWGSQYIQNIYRLAETFDTENRLPEAIKLYEEPVVILKALYEDSPEEWGIDYLYSIKTLAESYNKNNQLDDEFKRQKEFIQIIKHLYPNGSSDLPHVEFPDSLFDVINIYIEHHFDYYAVCLDQLADNYLENHQLSKGIKLKTEALPIFSIVDCLENRFDDWIERYANTLNNLADYYLQKQQLPEVILLQKESCAILKSLSHFDPRYIITLISLAESYRLNLQLTDAIIILEETYDRVKPLYQTPPLDFKPDFEFVDFEVEEEPNPVDWELIFTATLFTLAECYRDNHQFGNAIKFLLEVHDILKPLHQKNPQDYADTYIETIKTLSDCYRNNDQLSEGIELDKELLMIIRNTL